MGRKWGKPVGQVDIGTRKPGQEVRIRGGPIDPGGKGHHAHLGNEDNLHGFIGNSPTVASGHEQCVKAESSSA